MKASSTHSLLHCFLTQSLLRSDPVTCIEIDVGLAVLSIAFPLDVFYTIYSTFTFGGVFLHRIECHSDCLFYTTHIHILPSVRTCVLFRNWSFNQFVGCERFGLLHGLSLLSRRR